MKKRSRRSSRFRALRKQAEHQLESARGHAVAPPGEAGVRVLLHELQVHQIELELQNEALLRAQSDAQDAAGKYADLFEFAPVAYFIVQPEGTIREVNHAAATLLGTGRDRLVGCTFLQCVAPADQPAFVQFWAASRKSPDKRACELQLLGPGASPRDVQLEVVPSGDRNRSAAFYRVAAIDITTRKKAEDDLRQLAGKLESRVASRTAELLRVNGSLRAGEHLLQAAFDVAAIGMAQADPRTGRFLRVNRKMAEITGYSVAELEHLKISDLTHPDDRARDREAFQRVIRGEQSDYHLEKRYIRKDRALRWVHVHVTIIRDEAGRPLRTMAAIEDITQRRHMAREMISAIEREQERIGQDLHDGICQVLTGAKFKVAFLEQRLQGGIPPRPGELRRIERHLAEAIEQARDISYGLNPVKRHPTGLMSALDQLARMVSCASGPQCVFRMTRPVHLEDNVVAIHLFRIAQEAVQNALKHSHARLIIIGLSKRADTLELTVTDDGRGLGRAVQIPMGSGLANMRARAEIIGATLHLQPGEQGGLAVVCRLTRGVRSRARVRASGGNSIGAVYF